MVHLGKWQDYMDILHAMWQALGSYIGQAGWIGVLGHDPPNEGENTLHSCSGQGEGLFQEQACLGALGRCKTYFLKVFT